MRTIVGRLADLRLRELFKLLASAGAEGRLLIDTSVGRAELLVREGEVCGAVTPPLVVAYTTRSGSFSFHPESVQAEGWMPTEEFLLLVEARAGEEEGGEEEVRVAPAASEPSDPLGELRDSLAEIPLGQASATLLVASADPRPYRALESVWRRRGWEMVLLQEPRWPEEAVPDAVVLHLPSSGTLAGQEAAWLGLLRRASSHLPPVPTVWIGGLADPELRHEAIVAGADFLLPAPMGEVGEAARRFREELTVVLERLLSLRHATAENAAEAFRDFFLALHADAAPAELRASLLRVAATSFRRGVLVAVRPGLLETLGGFGLGQSCPRQVSRGIEVLERAIATRRAIRCADVEPEQRHALGVLLAGGAGADGEILPLLEGEACVGVFVGDGSLRPGESTAALAMLLARSGTVVGH
ncbi:MAG: DUF4388 domain-containing protein [Thermoanaerobaculaceae bacterium]|nr:DUF4388 domain-containing protein [Thermoanaerobaculaceae bacterium]